MAQIEPPHVAGEGATLEPPEKGPPLSRQRGRDRIRRPAEKGVAKILSSCSARESPKKGAAQIRPSCAICEPPKRSGGCRRPPPCTALSVPPVRSGHCRPLPLHTTGEGRPLPRGSEE